MKRGEHYSVTFDASIPSSHCAACRRALTEGENRLKMTIITDDGVAVVAICRDCLAEHAPDLLEDIESGEYIPPDALFG